MVVVRNRHRQLQLKRHRRTHYRKQFKRRALLFCGVFAVIAGGLFFAIQRAEAPRHGDLHLPFQNVAAQDDSILYTAQPESSDLVAAAAIGVQGQGTIAIHGDEGRRPMASIAKVITSLALIEKNDLKPGEQGPDIPLTTADEALFQEYIAKNGSVVPVTAGETISLRHAIEAMILPSANNISDTAAIWGFGSMKDYHKYANSMLKKYGLKNTTVGGDASGYDPATQSTPDDLIKLGELALNAPALMEIAGMHEMNLPGVGVIENYNRLVTEHDYTGLKPGDTDEAGRTLLFTTKHIVNGEEVNLIGIVLGVTDPMASPYDLGFSMMESAKATLKEKE